MSDVDPVVSALEGHSADEPSEVQEQEPELTEFGQRYLSTIEDEAERQIAERHVRKWDAGYAKQEEKWNSFKTQYEELGDLEDLKVGRQLHNLWVTDPGKIAQYLFDLGVFPQDYEPKVETQAEEVDPTTEKLGKLEQAMNLLVQKTQHDEAERAQKAQLEEFHRDLQKAKEELGDFDDQTVIQLIAGGPAGITIEAAVKQYQKLVQNTINQNARQQAPSLLGSSGAPPTQKRPEYGKMGPKDVVNYIAAQLSQEG